MQLRSLGVPLLVVGVLGSGLAPRLRAGSAGVRDGSISGVVVDAEGRPVPGVFVVAQRTDAEPRVIRSTRTDASGRYYLGLPLGGYLLGFSHAGFETVDTAQGDPNNQTALGAQVRAFVESGRNSVVQDIPLTPLPSAAAGDVSARLIDAVTGEAVADATLVIGPVATRAGGPDGVFRLSVPPRREGTELQPVPVVVQADGFRTFEGEVKVVPEATQSFTFALQPQLAILTGFVALDPTLPAEQATEIRVLASGVPDALAQGRVLDSSGLFQIQVPASTASRARSFDLQFVLRNARVATLTGVVSPRAGARTVEGAVFLEAEKTEVAGAVVSSDGSIPTGGRITQAVLVELGRAVPIVNGAFVLTGVPVGRPLTLEVVVENPSSGSIEVGTIAFTAASAGDGSSFHLPPVVTRAR